MGIKKVYGTILFVFLAALFCAGETSGAQTTSDSAMDFVGVPDSGFKVEGPGLSGVQRPAPMVLTDLNQASCYGQPGGFVIIETDPKILEKRLDEIDLTNSEMADPSTRTENLVFPPSKDV